MDKFLWRPPTKSDSGRNGNLEIWIDLYNKQRDWDSNQKNFLQRKLKDKMVNFTKHYQKNLPEQKTPIFHKLFQRIEEEGSLPDFISVRPVLP